MSATLGHQDGRAAPTTVVQTMLAAVGVAPTDIAYEINKGQVIASALA